MNNDLETTQPNPATAGRLTDAEVIAAQMRAMNFAMDAIFGPQGRQDRPARLIPQKRELSTNFMVHGVTYPAIVEYTVTDDEVSLETVTWSVPTLRPGEVVLVEFNASELPFRDRNELEIECLRDAQS